MTSHNFMHMLNGFNGDLDDLAMPSSAAVLGCGFEHRPGAWARNWRRDAAATRRRWRLRYRYV
jgi:hypothetical protein